MGFAQWVSVFALAGMAQGCITPNNADIKKISSFGAGSNAVPTTPGGAKAARIVFRAANPSGSFNTPSSSTPAIPGQGLQAVRVFNTDGTLLANGMSDALWPKWIKSVEIGISGANNGSATDANCARFAAAATDGAAQCDFDLDGTSDVPCGAPNGFFRVSEKDCANGTITDGNGGGSDGVYLRIVLNRGTETLAAHENLLAVFEYGVGAVSSAPQDPTVCFKNGLFDTTATGCSDLVWQLFMKRNESEVVQPFYTLVPPTLASSSTTGNKAGFGVQTKDIVLPISQNQGLTTLQLSRIKALSPNVSTTFSTACKANSALCMGMVINAVTLFRI